MPDLGEQETPPWHRYDGVLRVSDGERHHAEGSQVSGYKVGPVLPPGERPWPVMWEQDSRIDDGHAHEWESVLLGAADHQRVEEIIRCAVCHAPRCGHSGDENPCMERRHHRTVHIYLNGVYEPVGGLLFTEENP